jgi:hypothetical protein
MFPGNLPAGAHCSRVVKIIACIEDPAVIKTTAWMQEVEQRREQLPKILGHLNVKASAADRMRPESRAPPQAVLFSLPEEQLHGAAPGASAWGAVGRQAGRGVRMSRDSGGVGRTGLSKRAQFAVQVE